MSFFVKVENNIERFESQTAFPAQIVIFLQYKYNVQNCPIAWLGLALSAIMHCRPS